MATKEKVQSLANTEDNSDELQQTESAGKGEIIQAEITKEMQRAYLDYAMSVIVSRALPDVRDGLKPVHRRIIYAMQDQNMTASGRFIKCAAVVGEVMKKYHPHGDSAIYDSLVRMGQDFSLRYPLIIPQGNFGSIDGDPPAAMRYTESKMSKIAEELYKDIEKETVDFELNDLQNYEPAYLPSVLPNLLLNGSEGIAVGMATKIPPHNLGEVIDAINLSIDMADNIGSEMEDKTIQIFDQTQTLKALKPAFSSEANVEDLVKHIKGPDFPTGGIIYDQKEIMHMYATGKGRVVTRAKINIEESKTGKVRIIITEIPYQVNKAALISKIADHLKNKKIEGISDIRDESNKQGMRVVIELKKDAVAKKIENQLYKYTQLQDTFNGNLVALIDNEPKLMTLKMIIEEFIKHRQQVTVRRTLYLLRKNKEREHILQGLKIALDFLDEVIKLIRASKDADAAKEGLMTKFKLSQYQAQAILDMQLRRLAALERKKIEDELEQVSNTIKDFEGLVSSPQRIIDTVRSELNELKEKYGDERKTKVIKGKVGELSDEDLIVDEPCIITISASGYIKRLKEDTYKKQGRGGKGVKGQELKEEDTVDTIKLASSHDWAFFFSSTGKVYKMRVWEIPESSRTAKGTPLVNFLSIPNSEKVHTLLTMDSDTLDKANGYIFMVTENGTVKKTPLSDFSNIRSSGILAIKMRDDDSLVFAGVTQGNDDILLTTKQGMSIRFSEKEVRDMGRSAGGVTGIRLARKDDMVVGTVIIPHKSTDVDLFVVADRGYGKKTTTVEYKTQGRGGSGILTYKVTDKTGALVAARSMTMNVEGDILIATQSGKFLRLSTSQVPELGRNTQGVKLIRLDESDRVTSVAVIEEAIAIDEEMSIA